MLTVESLLYEVHCSTVHCGTIGVGVCFGFWHCHFVFHTLDVLYKLYSSLSLSPSLPLSLSLSLSLYLFLLSLSPSLQTATVLAKQLVKLRQQKTKSYGLSATISATGHQMKVRQLELPVAHSKPNL